MDYVGLDYVGADDELEQLLAVAGDDDDDEVGAAPRNRAKARASLKKDIALRKLSMARNLPAIFLGFDQTVAASGTAQATSEGNVKLRPTDLIIKASNADDFQITSIRIGRVDLLAGSTGIPAGAFVSTVQRPPVSAPELEAGTQSVIALTNITALASRFMAMFTALDLSRRPVSP